MGEGEPAQQGLDDHKALCLGMFAIFGPVIAWLLSLLMLRGGLSTAPDAMFVGSIIATIGVAGFFAGVTASGRLFYQSKTTRLSTTEAGIGTSRRLLWSMAVAGGTSSVVGFGSLMLWGFSFIMFAPLAGFQVAG